MQAVEVLRGVDRGQQRVRSRIVVGIVERLHRNLQHHLVAGLARACDLALEVAAIGREGERDRARQLAQRVGGGVRADAQPADHDRDARSVALAVGAIAAIGLDRTREGLRRPRSVLRDLRQRAVARRFGQALVIGGAVGHFGHLGRRHFGCHHLGRPGCRRDHDVAPRAGAAVDDGDGLGAGGRRRRGRFCTAGAPAGGAPGGAAVRRSPRPHRSIRWRARSPIGSPPSGSLPNIATPASTATGSASSAAMTGGHGMRQALRRVRTLPCPSGVLRSSVLTGQNPRESAPRNRYPKTCTGSR